MLLNIKKIQYKFIKYENIAENSPNFHIGFVKALQRKSRLIKINVICDWKMNHR